MPWRTLEMENAGLRQLLDSAQRRIDRLEKSACMAKLGQWDLDLATNELLWNDEVFEIFEVDKSQFGASYEAFLALVHPEDRKLVDLLFQESLVSLKKPYSVTHRLLFADGRVKWVYETCLTESVTDDQGHVTPVHSIGTVQDVTQMKRNEIKLQNALKTAEEASDARHSFLSRTSHELRTPIHGIFGMLSVVSAEQSRLSDQGREALAAVRDSADGLLRLLDGILDISRLENEKLVLAHEPLSPVLAVRSVCRLHSARGVRIALKVLDGKCAPPEWVIGDADRFAQIVQNLVGNAVKFTPLGGLVTVTVGQCTPSKLFEVSPKGTPCDSGEQATCSSFPASGGARDKGYLGSIFVEVADTGIGIPGGPREWEAIFELFRQSHWQQKPNGGLGRDESSTTCHADSGSTRPSAGSGMGLAIARQLARLMDGDVRIVSSIVGEANSGSIFRAEVSLPLGDEVAVGTGAVVPLASALHEREVKAAVAELKNPCLRILVVDDNPINRTILSHMLNQCQAAIQHTISFASDGREALQMLGVPSKFITPDDSPSEPPPICQSSTSLILQPLQFDAVLMDMHMPEMGGIEATRILRKYEADRNASRFALGLSALPSVLVSAVTASALPEEQEYCRASGTDFFLAKPFTQERLDALVLEMLAEQSARTNS